MYHHLRPVAARLLGGVAVCGGGVALAKAQREDECDATVDYIVVGAGSSGCAVAARLALIRPNYLTDPEGYDLKLLVDGVKLCRDLGRRICADVGATEVHPGPAVETDADVEDYVRKYVSTMYHPVGTCRMGDVVDAALRVRGVAGLRVADASVMPDIVGCNTNATCVMIGERCADLGLTAEPP